MDMGGQRKPKVGGATRRAVTAAALGATVFGGWAARGAVRTVRLRAAEAERALPARWLGYNTPANYDIPIEDPAFRDAVAALRPHLLRFPGGTVANYYQPETGQLDFGDFPDGSVYRKYLQKNALPAARRLHPNGVFAKQYLDLCGRMGAELLVVPNLETSPVEDQAAWFARMNADGFRPRLVEMGNEFYLALLMDPVTLRIFPDWATTIRRTKTYADALRPRMDPDGKVAVQSASSRFHVPYGTGEGDARRAHEHQWDDDMRPEPWFDAVTSHLYPTLEGSAGPGALAGLPGNVDQVYPALLARADDGFERSLAATAARMPGKEIWVTEWGAFEPSATLGDAHVAFDGMWLHMIVRGLMAMLRRKEVTVSTPHALFAQGNLMSAFRRAGVDATPGGRADLGGAGGPPGGYVPINSAGVLHWFCDAARGPDAHYRRLSADGSQRIAASGTIAGEGFRDVEAALFRVGRDHTLFIQNAWKTAAEIDLSEIVDARTPASGDLVETPELLGSLQTAAPQPRALAAGPRVVAPAHSLVRLRWRA